MKVTKKGTKQDNSPAKWETEPETGQQESSENGIAEQTGIHFLRSGDIDGVEGTYSGFLNGNFGISLLLSVNGELTSVPLNTMLKKLLKVNLSKLRKGVTRIKIIRGEKPEGKSYYLSSIFFDGELCNNSNILDEKDAFDLL